MKNRGGGHYRSVIRCVLICIIFIIGFTRSSSAFDHRKSSLDLVDVVGQKNNDDDGTGSTMTTFNHHDLYHYPLFASEEQHVVDNCTKWIEHVFNECITNRMELSGFWMSLISIAIWVWSQFPQLVENIKRQDASALSGVFLCMFFVGDIFNLVATVLMGDFGTQLYASIFFILMDLCLVSQWVYYKGKVTLKERKLRKDKLVEVMNYNDTDVSRRSYGTVFNHGALKLPWQSGTTPASTGYGYYSTRSTPSASHIKPVLINENDSSAISVYSTEDSEVLTAYDTQDEDNVYQQKPSDAILKTPPNRTLSFIREGGYTNQSNSPSSASKKRLLVLLLIPAFIYLFNMYSYKATETSDFSVIRKGSPMSRSLLSYSSDVPRRQVQLNSGKVIAGYVLGWIAAVLSVFSRIPQVIKNRRRRSTEGLSVLFFLFSMGGNAAFALSVLLFSIGSDFIVPELPWLLGTLGAVILDAVLVLQCYLYHSKKYIHIFDPSTQLED